MANAAKRSHKDSSDSEEEIKKRRYEDSSEEEEDEENDEEDEVEMDEVRNAQNVTLPAGLVKWSVEDSHRLLVSIMMLLPQCDVELYSEQEAQIDWEKVAFGSFSADHCREHWHELTKKVRVYRTMSDMVTDALSLLPRPASSFQMIQKINQMHKKKTVIVKKKSSLPKLVMNAFSLFLKDKIQTIQHIPASERMKHVSQLYKLLSETEKNELMERYDELKKNHIKMLKKLKEDNPALAEEVDEQLIKLEKIPGKSKKPKVSVNQNNSILKYMSKKTTPAQTVGGSDRKNSDDLTKRSESKIKSTMAAEEEDSSASNSSDDKEESYLSSARSTKRSSPVKSASRHKKSKAIVEKHSVSDRSSSEDEEHKQRSRSPMKSHSAIPAEISPIKKSMQMTSLKPSSKPGNELKTSESKRKEKKKKMEKVTGLSQFVAAKKARYQQLYPELNDREVVMKLAGKWERLSEKKKNKYEKLALQKMSSKEVD